jgi:long-chain acyl-CoA synthetase
MFCVPIKNPNANGKESDIYRNPESVDKNLFLPDEKIKTIHDSYLTALKNSEKMFLGKREKKETGKLGEFKFTSYREVFRKAEAFGSALKNLDLVGLNNDVEDLPLKFVGFYTKTTYESFIADIGCCLYDFTIVPLYDTLGEKANSYVFDQTKLEVVLINSERMDNFVESLLNSSYCQYIKTIVVIDDEIWKEEWREKTKDKVTIYKFEQLCDIGIKNVQKWADVKSDSIYAFSYTSGTTSYPKGAMLSHGNIISIFSSIQTRMTLNSSDYYLSYLPLAHVLERVVFNTLLFYGCKIGVYSGSRDLLFEDIKVLKPTLFISVPRVFNKIYTTIMAKFEEKNWILRKLIKIGLDTKIKNLKTKNENHHFLYDKLIFNKLKDFFGGRIKYFVTGGAPISEKIFDFFKVAFIANFSEVYGQTEGCGCEFSSLINGINSGHVGGPLIHNEFKLVDVPEMNYTHLDKDENGHLSPRGEIWVRGPNIIKGYYKLPDQTKETFVDGWLCSGDIGQIMYPDNRMVIIDRKKNIFKLSQGEYIAPEKLEVVYIKAHPLISNVFVYGNSLQDYIVGIVNIEVGCLDKVAKDFNCQSNPEPIAKILLEKFRKIGKENGFNSLEMFAKIIVVSEDWLEMGFVTVSLKNKRNDISNHYKTRLENLYNN